VKTLRRRGDLALQRIAVALFEVATPPLGNPTASPLGPEQPAGAPARHPSDSLTRFWGISERQRVDVVCAELPAADRPAYADRRDPNYVRYAGFADLDTLVYVRTRLAESFPDCYVRDFPASEYRDSQADHVIVLGGADWNLKAADFQEYLPVSFLWNEKRAKSYVTFDGEVRYPEWSAGESLIRDYAMFARIRLRQGLSVNLLAGCLTYGTLGAGYCFFDPAVVGENVEFAEEIAGRSSFAFVFTVQHIGGIVEPPSLRSDCVAAYRSDSEFSTSFRRIDF
jgi:hypothetical protein